MLNLHSRRMIHMNPERYERLLGVLLALRSIRPGQMFFIEELHLLLDESDRDPPVRHAMIGCLRRYGVIERQQALPVRYRVRTDRIDDVDRRLRAVLRRDRPTLVHPLRVASR